MARSVGVADAVIGFVAGGLNTRLGAGCLPMTPIVLVLAAVGGIAFAWLAVNRFWWMLLALFALRPALDGFAPKETAGGSSGIEPAALVGGAFLVAGILWLVVQYRSGAWTKLSRSSVAFLIFGGVALVSCFGSPLPIASLESASKVLSIAVMLAVLEQIFAVHPERIKPLLIATFASFVVPALVGYVQLRGSKPAQTYNAINVGRVDGTFVHPASFAGYLAIIIVLAVALAPYVTGRWRLSLGVIAVAALPLLLFTYARGAWVALYVALLVVGLAQSKWLVIGLLAGALLVVLTVPSVSTRLGDLSHTKSTTSGVSDPNSLSWRIRYWGRVLPLVKQNPITGIGFDIVRHTTPEKLPPHNGFVQAFVETGVIGLAAFLAIAVAIWADLRAAARRRRTGFGRGMTLATAAIALMLFMQLFSENLLGQSVILWYFLAPLAWVNASPVRAVPRRRSLTPAAT